MVIELDGRVSVDEVTTTEITIRISELTGIETSEILVSLGYDEERYAIRVLVTVPEEDPSPMRTVS